MKIIVADSSTLIALLDTDNFGVIFKLFDQVIISDVVYQEVIYTGEHQAIINRHIVQSQIDKQVIEYNELYEMLIKRLDRGEAESIVLAKKTGLPLLIDEKKGRSIAKSLGVSIIGLIGIILQLIKTDKISKQEAIEIVKQVEDNNFRLSDGLKALIYNRLNP